MLKNSEVFKTSEFCDACPQRGVDIVGGPSEFCDACPQRGVDIVGGHVV